MDWIQTYHGITSAHGVKANIAWEFAELLNPGQSYFASFRTGAYYHL